MNSSRSEAKRTYVDAENRFDGVVQAAQHIQNGSIASQHDEQVRFLSKLRDGATLLESNEYGGLGLQPDFNSRALKFPTGVD
jgi:hypothetical protein